MNDSNLKSSAKLKKPLKVAFLGMWDTGDEPFFWTEILTPLYDLQLDFRDKPDLVIFCGFHENYRFWWRTIPRIFHNSESHFVVDPGYYEYMFGHCADGPKSMHLNEYVITPFVQELILTTPPEGTTPPDTDTIVAELRAKDKTRFCNFVAGSIQLQSDIREAFAQQLMNYKHIDCPGKRLNNMPSFDDTISQFPDLPQIWKGKYSRKVLFQSDYKFSMAFENSSKENYISEKIFNAFAAGSIPIYWGAPNVGELLNTRAFINCHDYKDFDAVIAHIKEIDTNDALYQSYRRESPFLPGQPIPSWIDKEAFETRLVEVIARLTSKSFRCPKRPPILLRERHSALYNGMKNLERSIRRTFRKKKPKRDKKANK